MKKRVKQFKEDYTKTFITIIAILVILFLVFWVKIGLYINFMIGNDVLIKVDVNNDRFFLTNGESEDIKVEASVKTNPFCKAYCTLQFKDMAKDTVIDEQEFTLKAGLPFIQEYPITNSNTMQGQDIYSFRMECSGKQSFFCHTNEAPTRRDIIITVDHALSELQKQERKSIQTDLLGLGNALETQNSIYINLLSLTQDLNFADINEELTKEKDSLEYLQGSISQMETLWMTQKFKDLKLLISSSSSVIKDKLLQCKEYNDNVLSIINNYNILITDLNTAKEQLTEIKEPYFTSNSMFLAVKQSIVHYNSAVTSFVSDSDLNSKTSIVNWIKQEVDNTYNNFKEDKEYEVLEREINGDTDYDTLCMVDAHYCFNHPNVDNRAEQEEFDILESCQYIDDVNSDLNVIKVSIEPYVTLTYPSSQGFWDNVSDILSNRKRLVLLDYLNQTNPSQRNYDKINNIITIPAPKLETLYSSSYIKTALVWQLIKERTSLCTFVSGTMPNIDNTSFNQINIIEPAETKQGFNLREPNEQCCLFSKCYDCCLTEDCRNNPDSYPIVLVHGHAVNKDTSAEYSLDIFNDLQDWLEDDNYLSAGAINLYAEQGGFKDKWAKIPTPLTIKVSYYFDLLQEEGNYQIVQTKSENIETYSLRLKEIIDVVKEKTDRPKVKIVAHSMGGLVVRRYLQIFGEDNVESVTFVGTPHKGVVGQVADLCPVLGEELECRDLTEGSVFMRKLEIGGLPLIDVTNIVGSGCEMGKEDGDGVVVRRNAIIQEFDNFIINGSCTGTNFLHSSMLNLNKHYKTYSIIRNGIE